MKPRIYVDTSVVGGCLDAEFQTPSARLFDRFRVGEAILVLSELTLLELEHAPPEVRAVLQPIPEEHREYLAFTAEAAELARSYIAAGVVDGRHLVDAQHIAMATVHRVNVLVSWNFRHVVNLQRVQGYNSVNLRHGYPLLEIRAPWEVLTYEEE